MVCRRYRKRAISLGLSKVNRQTNTSKNRLIFSLSNAGLTEFRIEVGVHRAPINEPWEPSAKGREPYFLGEIISILQQKIACLGGVLK